MNSLRLLSLTLLAALVTVSLPQPSIAAEAVTVKPVSISIALKDPDSQFNSSYMPGTQPGVQIGLLVKSEKRTIVSVKVDVKNPLVISAEGQPISGESDNSHHMMGANVSDDGQRATLRAGASKLPPQGTKSVSVAGQLLVSTGSKTSGEKVAAKFAKGTKLKLAGIAVEVTEVGKPDWGDEPLSVTLTTSDAGAFDKIKEIKFLDESGKEITSKSGGTMTMNFGGNSKVSVDYRLAKKVDAATIEIVYYSDLTTKPLPVKVELGLGL